MAARVSSRPCDFDVTLLALLCQCFEEEYYCDEGDETGCLIRRGQMAKAAKDDVYKDDFSSDDDITEEESKTEATQKRLKQYQQ